MNPLEVISTITGGVTDIKAQADEALEYTKAYMATQFVLQLIATGAMVGLFLIALQNKGKK